MDGTNWISAFEGGFVGKFVRERLKISLKEVEFYCDFWSLTEDNLIGLINHHRNWKK